MLGFHEEIRIFEEAFSCWLTYFWFSERVLNRNQILIKYKISWNLKSPQKQDHPWGRVYCIKLQGMVMSCRSLSWRVREKISLLRAISHYPSIYLKNEPPPPSCVTRPPHHNNFPPSWIWLAAFILSWINCAELTIFSTRINLILFVNYWLCVESVEYVKVTNRQTRWRQ